jgi:hypothetical protein
MYFLVLANIALGQIPSPPVWGTSWAMNFTETVTDYSYGVYETTGTYYYYSSAAANLTRVDRTSGRSDGICGYNDWFKFIDTPCQQIVNGPGRYIVYPNYQICCFCCSSADGCGALSPTWLQTGTYLGSFNYAGQTPAYLWDVVGNSDNFYWETASADSSSRIPLEIDNGGPDRAIRFEPNITTNIDLSVFNLPSYCNSAILCDGTSVCSDIRGSSGKSEHLKHLKL